MSTEDNDKLAAGCSRIVARLFIVTVCLSYVINFWLGFHGRPQVWSWYYGLPIGLVPHSLFAAMVAAAATFIATFFL